jgi:hypothetical protein
MIILKGKIDNGRRRALTVVSSPSHRLSTIPGGEGVGRETRVDQGKMGGVLVVLEIIEKVVDLNGRELTLVDNVLVGKRADVKPVLESDGVSGLLSQEIQLTVEELVVELCMDGRVKNDKGLLDRGLL